MRVSSRAERGTCAGGWHDDTPLIRPSATFSPTSGEKDLSAGFARNPNGALSCFRSFSPLVGEKVAERSEAG